ncbi:MAG: hypothetical protein KC415_17835, partial [Anaerolineales bacterium]|nr:hypothetical protein [Anaerolineales bacterium]
MGSANQYQLRLLGPFEIEPSVPTLRRKTRALLAYLAMRQQAHNRQALMAMFCQEANEPARVLTLLLSRIRKKLPTILQTDGPQVRLNPEQIWVDTAVFQTTLSDELTERTVDELETAVSLYRADLLADLTLKDAPEFELWLLA